jgi:predicted permease
MPLLSFTEMMRELPLTLRSLVRMPRYALSVIAILSLGFGCAASIFSLIADSLRKPSDYPQIERLVKVEMKADESPNVLPVFLARYSEYKEAASFQRSAVSVPDTVNLVIDGVPEAEEVARVSLEYCAMFGVEMKVGRAFLPEDYRSDSTPCVIISYRTWTSRFGSDPDVVGRTIALNGSSYVVIGVLAHTWRPPLVSNQPLLSPFIVPPITDPIGGTRSVFMFAQLRAGITHAQAAAELRAMRPNNTIGLQKAMERYMPVVTSIDAMPASPIAERFGNMLRVAAVAISCLYLTACFNAGSLMLVRSVGRRREIALRVALGSGLRGVIMPLLLEGAVLSISASLLGLLLSKWVFSTLVAYAPGDSTVVSGYFELKPIIVLSLLLISVATGVVVSVTPALWALKVNVTQWLKEGGIGGGYGLRTKKLRCTVIVAEIGGAFGLLVCAGLMTRTFDNLQAFDYGFDQSGLTIVSIRESRADDLPAKNAQLRNDQIAAAISQLSGVTKVGLASSVLPLRYNPRKIQLNGTQRTVEADLNAVSPDFLTTLGVTLLKGEGIERFRPSDKKIALVNSTFAKRYFPDGLAVGATVGANKNEVWEIVGVVSDVAMPRNEPQAWIYFPSWQRNVPLNQVAVRTSGAISKKFAAEVNQTVFRVDPKLAVTSVRPVSAIIEKQLLFEAYVARLLRLTGLLAVVLASVGLYALQTFSVSQRQHEIGIRYSVGATPSQIRRMLTIQGMRFAILGITFGSGFAWILSRLCVALLFDTSALDYTTYIGVAIGVMIIMIPACWIPAQRAARFQVSELLRTT